MQREDRLIHFATELVHGPRQHERQALQKLYFDLSQMPHAAYDNIDFSQATHARFHSRRGKAQSFVLFLPDRVLLGEEWSDIVLGDFLRKVDEIGKRVVTDLGASVINAQTATVRSTFALSHFDDARIFLLDHLCGQEGKIGPHFRRPMVTGGLRFVLPETPEHKGAYHVLIESFRHNAKEIFVEVKGVFANVGVDIENVHRLGENVTAVRKFILDSVFPFLDQYDTPQEVDS